VLSQRFQIQELVTQDLFGVIFHALDVKTGAAVALRRFFPFGVNGGGLFDEERGGYDMAVARLTGLTHPGLRAVLAGGCDPVDGMPFVVTEWIAGESLAQILERGFLTPAATLDVLDLALELSEAMSQVLGEEALWVETDPAMILVDSEENGRGFTFCISPIKWLGEDASRGSLLGLADLAEAMLGWRDRLVGDQAAGGLGAWVKWLKANAETITLPEVRQSLARFTGTSAPEPAGECESVSAPEPAPLLVEPPTFKRQLWLIGVLVVLVGMVGGYLMLRQPPSGVAAQQAPAAEVIPQDAASKRLAEVNAQAAALANGGRQQVEINPKRSAVFQIEDTERLINEKGREVTVEGRVTNVRLSDAGKTLYLEFSDDSAKEQVRGCIMTQGAPEDMSAPALKLLEGKRVQITGVVRIKSYFKKSWPEVMLKDRRSIKEM
jgi:hypothetical protein